MPIDIRTAYPDVEIILWQPWHGRIPDSVEAGAARFLTSWIAVETSLSALFIELVGPDRPANLVLYERIASINARKEAIELVAKGCLPEGEYRAVRSAMKDFTPLLSARHEIAHWPRAVLNRSLELLVVADPAEALRWMHHTSDADTDMWLALGGKQPMGAGTKHERSLRTAKGYSLGKLAELANRSNALAERISTVAQGIAPYRPEGSRLYRVKPEPPPLAKSRPNRKMRGEDA